MNKLYHICLTSHSEVLFRNEEDFLRGINCLAIVCLHTGSRVGTFSFQSDHVHFDIFTEDPSEVVCRFKCSYTKYFNSKYCREGPLLDEKVFYLELVGSRHIEAAESYILRNSVHHAITETPFSYPYNSSSCYFSSDFSRHYLDTIDFSKYGAGCFLPPNRRPSGSTLLNNRGMIKAECFMEISLVEKFFGSARAFNYCMTRLSGEEWERSQQKDGNNALPVTIKSIEQGYSDDYEQMLVNERGKRAGIRMTDIQLCGLIDGKMLKNFGVSSYTQLSLRCKEEIYRFLKTRKDCCELQIRRCLALPAAYFSVEAAELHKKW